MDSLNVLLSISPTCPWRANAEIAAAISKMKIRDNRTPYKLIMSVLSLTAPTQPKEDTISKIIPIANNKAGGDEK